MRGIPVLGVPGPQVAGDTAGLHARKFVPDFEAESDNADTMLIVKMIMDWDVLMSLR